jgi:hypothetical protein
LALAFPSHGQTLLHIRVAEGDGSVHAVGSRDHLPLAVQITDETGRPVDTATVTFRLPEEGPGGVFPRGMRTEVVTTAADGNAVVQGMVWNRLPGAFQIRITAVKGQVRAGTVVSQYISDAPQAKAVRAGSSRAKWLTIAAIGAGAAVGIAVGMAGSSQPSASASNVPPPYIGAPTISIGAP